MDLLTTLSFVVGAVGTALAIAAAVRGRQLSRPKLIVTIAPPEPDSGDPRAIRQASFGGLVVGTAQRTDARQFVCPILLRNQSAIPISDLVLRLEYSDEYLMKHVVFVDGQKKAARVFRFKDDREAFQISGMASVSLDIGLLRPGDSVMTADVIHLKRLRQSCPRRELDDEDVADRTQRRFSEATAVIGIVPINVYIRASNIPPQALTFALLWLQGESVAAVVDATAAVAHAAWEGRRPEPGHYFRLRLPALRKPLLWRRERFRVLFIDGTGHAPMNPDELLQETLTAQMGDSVVELPPWGLTGKSFDLSAVVGVRVWPPSKAV